MVALQAGLVAGAASLLVCAAGYDVAFRKLPNWLPIAVACTGAALRAAEGSLLAGLGAAAAVFIACFCLWRRGLMGGGDVKLFGAAALAVPAALPFVLATMMAGGVLGLLYVALRRCVPRRLARPRTGLVRRILRVEQRRIRDGHALPYCCAIAAGAFLTFAGA